MVKPTKKINVHDNRLNFVLAIIFLFGAMMAAKLFYLQVWRNSYYQAKASGQQQVNAVLDAARGQILVNNYNPSLNESSLSALATNKNFAVIYAVPKDLDLNNVSSTAEKIYDTFDAQGVEADVDKKIASEDQSEIDKELSFINSLNLSDAERTAKQDEILNTKKSLQSDATWSDFRKTKRDLMINEEKLKITNNYLLKLNKPGDPYEELKKKVSDDDLLKFYATLLGLDPAELEFRNNKIYKIGDDDKNNLEYKGFGYTMTSYRYYPEGTLASNLIGFVNYNNVGTYGLEAYYNDELSGTAGVLKGERGSGPSRSVVIADDREHLAPVDGSDIVLTIDRAVEYYVCQKLEESRSRYKFDSGSVIIVKPDTGEIIAMCSYPNFDPNNYKDVSDQKFFMNPIVSSQYEPGSVFKTITMAAAVDQKKVTPNTTYNDTGKIMISGWSKPINNSDSDTFGAHGKTDMTTVLEKSLNLGAIFSMQQVGPKVFTDYVKNFGFGEKTGIELGSEAGGNINNLLAKNVKPIDAATASFGQGLTATPLQMLMSYAAIANHGILMKPYIVKGIIKKDGTKIDTKPREVRQVISEETANTISAMLVNVAENGTAKKARVNGYYIGGKTGTAQISGANGKYLGDNQYIHTFVGIAPINKPKFVMLVKMDKPKGFKYAESTATPLFGEIADFLLKYYQVPKER
ncbi:MAG: penicillin-binding protein 2 [Candidatus Falkowbacteria bacterium]